VKSPGPTRQSLLTFCRANFGNVRYAPNNDHPVMDTRGQRKLPAIGYHITFGRSGHRATAARASSLSCAVRFRATHPGISMPTSRPALGGTTHEAALLYPVGKTPKAQASSQSMLPPSTILRIMVAHGFRSQNKMQL